MSFSSTEVSVTTPLSHTLMLIRIDDLAGAEIRDLLEEHLRSMYELSPPESVHALDLAALRRPEITFWTAWSERELLGCGALKELDPAHGEIKSMRTTSARRRTGVGRAMLEHIIAEARARSYCAPFADYADDPNSSFMTRTLE
jgi:putative acetyltransferase